MEHRLKEPRHSVSLKIRAFREAETLAYKLLLLSRCSYGAIRPTKELVSKEFGNF